MKLVYEFDENEILEKVKNDDDRSWGIKETIIMEIKNRAINDFVSQINKIIRRSWRENDEYFIHEIQKAVQDRISLAVDKQIQESLNEKKTRNMVERSVEITMNEWIQKKVEEKLEQAKADIVFYYQSEVDEQEIDEDIEEVI